METLKNPSLFWDVRDVDPRKSEKFVIERILAYGDEKDFSWAKEFYGRDKIFKNFLKIRSLDKKSRSFWHQYFNLESKCIPKRSAPEQSAFWKR